MDLRYQNQIDVNPKGRKKGIGNRQPNRGTDRSPIPASFDSGILMARKDNYIVGLDIGSNKTCVVVSQPGENGKLRVVGSGVAESKGWRKGVIVNLDLAVFPIKKAIKAAEAAATVSIDSLYVAVGGTHI